MTKEKSFFICRNENCKTETNSSGESVSGGKVFSYILPYKGKVFTCPHCGSKYEEENGDVLLVFEEEKVIDNSDGYAAFKAQYETNRIHFRRLVLKNIHESDYKGKILSFNKCRIDDLVIEDVHLVSAFYPIIFSECRIDKVRISKSKVLEAKLNSYKSLWSFFGITFFQTEITENFLMDSCETSMAIINCAVTCPLDFSKKSKVELALIHNKRGPEVTADKGSVVKRLFEVTGRAPSAPSAPEKKINTSGKIIRNVTLDELYIDPDINKISVIENCSIRKLVFEEGASIKGKLVFKNCLIENIQNQPYCFEKDLVFLGCTLKDEFVIKRVNFKKSLVFEACIFTAGSIFNELKIEEDFYLNYSVFQKGLSVSGVRCGGYVKCEINTIQNAINFEDNVIAKDVNLSFIDLSGSIVLFHNEIIGYLFLTQIATKGKLDINMLNGEALTIDDVAIDASAEINQLVLKSDLKITSMAVRGDVNFFFTKIAGSFFLFRSSFEKDFLAYDLESKLNMFMNINFMGNGSFNSCKFSQQTWTSRNLFHDSLSWTSMHTHNISFNDNHLFESFTIDKTEARDLIIDQNFSGQDIEINNSKANDITVNDNVSGQNFNFRYLKSFDMAVNNNTATQGFEVSDIKANNFNVNDNKAGQGFSMSKSALNDIKFFDNLLNGDFVINNSDVKDLFINNNTSKQGFKLSYLLAFDIEINDNNARQNFDIFETKANNFSFNDNKIKKEFSLKNSELKDAKFYDNIVNEDFVINNSITRDIYLVRNQTDKEVVLNYATSNDLIFNENSASVAYFFNSFFADVSISKCTDIGTVSMQNLSAGKSLKIEENIVLENIVLQRCNIAKNFSVENNKAQYFGLSESETGDIRFHKNKLQKECNVNNLKSCVINFVENHFNEGLEFRIVKADDLYFTNNHIKQDLKILFTESQFLSLKDKNVRKLLIHNSNFADLTISEYKKIAHAAVVNVAASNNIKIHENIFGNDLYLELCTVLKNIEFVKNEIQHLDIINTAANDILLENNKVENTLYINDTKADDITLKGNEVATAEAERNEGEDSGARPRGIIIEQCTFESDLEIAQNNSPESVQFISTLGDRLSFWGNKTNLFKISMGRYRQVSIYYCGEIGKFDCNNVTVVKDIRFNNNIFLDDFDMLYCKIENDLECTNNQFNGLHRLNNNTVLGSLIYKTVPVEGIEFGTSFMYATIFHNKFNFVNFENIRINSTFYFDKNTVQGSLKIGMRDLSVTDTVISFPEAVSITENKVANAMFFNLHFESSLCLLSNNFDGNLTFRNTAHLQTMDFTGCYVGGSFIFHNARGGGNNGDLVLDNTFIDKRISFNNYSPASFSFINATFNGFEIPREWKMKSKKLVKAGAKNKLEYILKENILQKKKFKDADLPYNLIKAHYESDDYFTDLPVIWRYLQTQVFSNEEKRKILLSIERGKEVFNAVSYIEPCVSKAFIPVYYGFFGKETVDALANLADYFAKTEHTSEDKEVTEIAEALKAFFHRFFYALKFFENRVVYWGSGDDKRDQRIYKKEINNSLEEQYHVLRHIFGSNGELKEEDSAYYKWMHYKNISEMYRAPLRSKPKYWIKYLFFEKIFGWGVDLFRILVSTGGLVVLFAIVYWVMFQFTPGLSIKWDEVLVQGSDIGFGRSFVFALQTTFSAILGDWAPIGSGSIKIPMTINAVLGILFVTFLIGAYGRKMLR